MAAVAVTEMSSQLHAAGGIVDSIKKALLGTAYNFCEIGYWLWYIREYKLYQEDGFANIYDFSRSVLNISRGNVSKLINICVKFSAYTVNLTPGQVIKKEYSYYSVSQLAEMLYLSDKKLEQVTPDMTVKEIRDIKEQEEAPEPKEEEQQDEYIDDNDEVDNEEQSIYSYTPEEDALIEKLYERSRRMVNVAKSDKSISSEKQRKVVNEEIIKMRIYARQRPQQVIIDAHLYKCPSCYSKVFSGDKYCNQCGQRFKRFIHEVTI